LWGSPEAYPRVEHLKDASLVLAPALLTNIDKDGKASQGQTL